MNIKQFFQGRINRKKYSIAMIAYFLVAFSAVIILSLTINSSDIGVSTADFFRSLFPLYIVPLSIKRYHDLGKSGWNVLWLLIPFAMLYLMFTKGQQGDNKYGKYE